MLELRDSRAFWATVAAAAVAGVVVTSLAGLPVFGVAVFGSYAAWAAWRLFDRPVRLAITDEGIVDRTFWFSPGLIPWEDVLDVRPGRFGLIHVELRDEGAFWDRLSPLKRLARWKLALYGLGPATINPWPLEASRRDIVGALEAALDAYLLEDVSRVEPVGDGAVP